MAKLSDYRGLGKRGAAGCHWSRHTAPWAGGLPFEVEFNYTYDGVMRAYEQVLQRLALNTVDSLVIHDLDTMFPVSYTHLTLPTTERV